MREVQAIYSTLRMASRESPLPQRFLVMVDPLVTRGVVAKGRSASRRLNAEWSRCVPICLGQGVAVGPIYVPTRLNPADGPSRMQDVAPPLWGPPAFAAAGDLEELDRWSRYPRQRRDAAPWARLVLRLMVFGPAHCVGANLGQDDLDECSQGGGPSQWPLGSVLRGDGENPKTPHAVEGGAPRTPHGAEGRG